VKNYNTSRFIFTLAPFVFSFAFGLDIYIPVVPEMTRVFHTTPALVQLTLSLFLLANGLGQLIVGPLSDQFGRRAILYVASALFAIGSLGCALADNIIFMIIARVVSAVGSCGMLVVAFAIVRDLFSGNESARMFSLLNGAIGISPIFAPIIGGYLALWLGWRSVFLFLVLLGVLGLAITKWAVLETHHHERRVKLNVAIFQRYWQIMTLRTFFCYASITGLSLSIFFCFFSVSPFIIIDILKISIQHFGYCFAVFGMVIAFGSLTAGKIVVHWGLSRTILIGIVLLFIGGAGMLIWYYAAGLSLFGFLIPMVVACTGAAFAVGAGAAGALEPFAKIAGTAAAAFGVFEFGLAAIVGGILMRFPVTSTVSYGICIVIVAVLSLVLFLMLRGNSVGRLRSMR